MFPAGWEGFAFEIEREALANFIERFGAALVVAQ